MNVVRLAAERVSMMLLGLVLGVSGFAVLLLSDMNQEDALMIALCAVVFAVLVLIGLVLSPLVDFGHNRDTNSP